MKKHLKNSAKRVGLPPGTLLHVGELRAAQVSVRQLEYGELDCREQWLDLSELKSCYNPMAKDRVNWLHIAGLHGVSAVEEIGACFNLHPLVLEDILNTGQRPKLDDYGDYIFLVVKVIYRPAAGEATTEQISIVLGENFVLSFQETDYDLFAPVRERIKSGKGRIRRLGADYLAYSLLDTIVDNYFVILEEMGERLELWEDRLIIDPDRDILAEVYSLKTEMLFLRKAIWPLREVVNALERGESRLFRDTTLLYLRDVYDHIIQVIDTVETYRDMVAGMLDIYLSSVSHKLNEVMKVLTIISTIFIPLTFLAGVYGMNFKNMPELEWRWGYALFWAVIIIAGLAMVRYFRIKKWM
ncbi:MAG: magnesium/cobalt transporter CorA [Negativicutes bacterium]|nr:magnesium/cobalt transporter CorA [Negativicutes bacterium]